MTRCVLEGKFKASHKQMLVIKPNINLHINVLYATFTEVQTKVNEFSFKRIFKRARSTNKEPTPTKTRTFTQAAVNGQSPL